MYSPQLLDHFQNPRNAGEVLNPDATVQIENPACGDIMQLMLKVRAGRIDDVRFRTRGCVAAIACGSLLTELLHGSSLDSARALERNQLVAGVGGLSNESMHASHLAMDALRAALAQVKA